MDLSEICKVSSARPKRNPRRAKRDPRQLELPFPDQSEIPAQPESTPVVSGDH